MPTNLIFTMLAVLNIRIIIIYNIATKSTDLEQIKIMIFTLWYKIIR